MKKGDKNFISNYRPTSLLPILSNVYERVIHKQLYNYFNNENLLAEVGMLHLYQNIKFPLDYQCKVLHVVCI